MQEVVNMRINPDCQLDRTKPFETAYGYDPNMTHKFSQDGKLFMPNGDQCILDEDPPVEQKEAPEDIIKDIIDEPVIDMAVIKRSPGRPSLKNRYQMDEDKGV